MSERAELSKIENDISTETWKKHFSKLLEGNDKDRYGTSSAKETEIREKEKVTEEIKRYFKNLKKKKGLSSRR